MGGSAAQEREVAADHVHRDVLHHHLADRALGRAVMSVPVEHEIGPMGTDGRREAPRSEKRPDALRLADERFGDRRVMEQHDPAVTAGDGFQPFLEGVHFCGRLVVQLPEQVLPEVGDLPSRESADEPLTAHDPDVERSYLDHRVGAVEHDDTGCLERCHELAAPIGVVVVIAEHRNDRYVEAAARVSQDARLIGLPLRRQVAREQHEIDLRGHGLKRPCDPLPQGLGAVKVAGGSDTDRRVSHGRLRGSYPVSRFRERRNRVDGCVGYTLSDTLPELIETMKRASAALDQAGVQAMIGGGLAAWARGGPPTDHDVDFYLREDDAPRALEALVATGMRPETPPEGWLLKAYDGAILIDLIFRPSGGPIDDDHFARATPMELMAQPVLVASIDDVLSTKLLALSEQEPDFRSVLELARSLREQIDWDFVSERTQSSPFAAAFFTLVESLAIAPNGSRTTVRA